MLAAGFGLFLSHGSKNKDFLVRLRRVKDFKYKKHSPPLFLTPNRVSKRPFSGRWRLAPNGDRSSPKSAWCLLLTRLGEEY